MNQQFIRGLTIDWDKIDKGYRSLKWFGAFGVQKADHIFGW